jgi:hypothetical protein
MSVRTTAVSPATQGAVRGAFAQSSVTGGVQAGAGAIDAAVVALVKQLRAPRAVASAVRALLANASVAEAVQEQGVQAQKKRKRARSAQAVQKEVAKLHRHQKHRAFFIVFSDPRLALASLNRLRLSLGLETSSSAARREPDHRLRPYYTYFMADAQEKELGLAMQATRRLLSNADKEWRKFHHTDFNGGRQGLNKFGLGGWSKAGLSGTGDRVLKHFKGSAPPLPPELRCAFLKQLCELDPNVPESFTASEPGVRRAQVSKVMPWSPELYPWALTQAERRVIWLEDPEKSNVFATEGKTYFLGGKLVPNILPGKEGESMLLTDWPDRIRVLLTEEFEKGTFLAHTTTTVPADAAGLREILKRAGYPGENKLPTNLTTLRTLAIRMLNTVVVSIYGDGSSLNNIWGHTIVTVAIVWFEWQWKLTPGSGEYKRVKHKLLYDIEIDILARCDAKARTANALLGAIAKQLRDIPAEGLPLKHVGPPMTMANLTGTSDASTSSPGAAAAAEAPHIHIRAAVLKGDIPENIYRTGMGSVTSSHADPCAIEDCQQQLWGPCVITAKARTLALNTDKMVPLPGGDVTRTFNRKQMSTEDWKAAALARGLGAFSDGAKACKAVVATLAGVSSLSGLLLGDPGRVSDSRIKDTAAFPDAMHCCCGVIAAMVQQCITEGGRMPSNADANSFERGLTERGVLHAGSNNRGCDRVMQALQLLIGGFDGGVALPAEDRTAITAAIEIRKHLYQDMASSRAHGAQLACLLAAILFEDATEKAYGDETKVGAGSSHSALMRGHRAGILHAALRQRMIAAEQTLCEGNERKFKDGKDVVHNSNMHFEDCMCAISRTEFAQKVEADVNTPASHGVHHEESRIKLMYKEAGLGPATMDDGESEIIEFSAAGVKSAMYIFTMLANADICENASAWAVGHGPHNNHVRAVTFNCDRSLRGCMLDLDVAWRSPARCQALLATVAARVLEEGSTHAVPGWDNIQAVLSEINGIIDDLADEEFVGINGDLFTPLRQFMLDRGCTEGPQRRDKLPLLVQGKPGTAQRIWEEYVAEWAE